ncbi:MAG: hypothetical protein LAN37_11070 [Acidobacteriia bacterium]|nr:hypothetical protein [Terriglobia bacterium]
MPNKQRFVICIKNQGYSASLEIRKLYATMPDAQLEKRGFLRVVDESGEDYIYPASLFIAAELPQRVKRAVAAAS